MENRTIVENTVDNDGSKIALCPLCHRPVVPVGEMVPSPKNPGKLACRRCRRTFWRAECVKVDAWPPRGGDAA